MYYNSFSPGHPCVHLCFKETRPYGCVYATIACCMPLPPKDFAIINISLRDNAIRVHTQTNEQSLRLRGGEDFKKRPFLVIAGSFIATWQAKIGFEAAHVHHESESIRNRCMPTYVQCNIIALNLVHYNIPLDATLIPLDVSRIFYVYQNIVRAIRHGKLLQ